MGEQIIGSSFSASLAAAAAAAIDHAAVGIAATVVPSLSLPPLLRLMEWH